MHDFLLCEMVVVYRPLPFLDCTPPDPLFCISLCVCQGGLPSAGPQEKFVELLWEVIGQELGSSLLQSEGSVLEISSQLLNEGRG